MSDKKSLSIDEDKEISIKSSASSITCNMTTVDYRFLWIWDKVMKFFLLDSSHQQLFDNLLNENNFHFNDRLAEFFNSELYGEMDLEKKVIYFYKTYRKEIIQEEILVWEESNKNFINYLDELLQVGHVVKAPAASSFSAKNRSQRLTKSAPGKVEEEKSRGKGKKKKGKKEIISDENSISSSNIFTGVSATNVLLDIDDDDDDDEKMSMQEDDEEVIDNQPNLQKSKPQSKSSSSFEPPPGEENKYILTKKMVDKEVELPVLHIIFGEIPTNDSGITVNSNFIYFLRTSEEEIPQFNTQQECNDNITSFLIIGSLNGPFLETLNNMLLYVFKPLVEKQYRGTSAALQQLKKYGDEQINENLDIIESQTSEFTKASNYHKLSTTIENLNVNLIQKQSSSEKNLINTQTPSVQKTDEDSAELPLESSKIKLLEYLDKLITSVGWTLKHIEGDVLLQLPKLTDITNMDLINTDLSKLDTEKIEQIEEIIMTWGKHIEKVLNSYVHEIPQGKDPLAEYNHWHNRETGLSMLVEQLNLPVVKKILSSSEINSSVTSAFHWFEIELWKLYTEARNNNKFLVTVLRYFELIAKSDDFEAISEIIPSLMEGMRMIWVLSKYYNSEGRMTSLLERVSWQLCENVKKNLSIKELFSKPLIEILRETKNAHAMMNSWRASYLKTRTTIELTEKGTRWEFNQQQLFKKTDYIAKVCNDLNKIASVLEDFYNIFGVELKSIVNDPIQIDTMVKKVDEMIIPIQNSDFNIFSEFNKENWDATMVWFYLEVASLENEAKFLIDDCFTVLISAEQALQLLVKFKNIKTRQAIQECLLRKFDVIMQQFSKEMNEVENIFNLSKKNPPILKYHSHIVGAIFWERQLFHRLKKSITTFKDVPELNDSNIKTMAFNQYLRITKQIEQFEASKYKSWIERAESLTKHIMSRKILKTIIVEDLKLAAEKQMITNVLDTFMKKPKGRDSRLKLPSLKNISGGKNIYFDSSKLNMKSVTKSFFMDHKQLKHSTNSSRIEEISHPTKVTWVETVDDKIMAEKQLSFQVNFNYQVLNVIDEAELLELLGFEIPLTIRDVCIQKDRLKADIDSVQTMIDQYNNIVDKLDDADVKLLMKEIKIIEKYIQSGVLRLNWSSLEISNYADQCKKLLRNLGAIVTQLEQMKNKLNDLIDNDISCYNLCATTDDPNDPEYELSLCKTYFLDIETKRTELVCEMLAAYQSTAPLLIKIENLVEGTSTGKSEAMQNFYRNYEKKIHTALITCFTRNLKIFNNLLSGNKAIFLVDAVLLSSEVILRPSPNEINVVILHDIKDLLEKCKMFPRWIAGSCLICKPIKSTNNDDSYTFSFFEDIMSIQIINNRIREIHETIQKLAVESWKYMYKWKKYHNLWRLDKTQVCEKFATSNPTLHRYDEKFTFYDSFIEEVETMTPYYDVFSIRINLSPLIKSIKYHVQEWKQILGNFLLTQVQGLMNSLKIKIEKFRSEIELVITGLNRFKTVMQSITNIKNMAIQAEVEYNEYQETFRILKTHGISYPAEDEAQAYKLQQDWQSIYFGALFRAKTLYSTKDCFCEMSKEQIANFLKECAEFVEYFKKEGPGSVGNNLDAGLMKMEECVQLIQSLEERQDDLIKAEGMFDLAPTDYSIFTKVKEEFEDMKLIYSLYRKQKDARDAWSKILWADLNPQDLIDGMEHFISEFQDLPQAARQLRVGKSLISIMEAFKNSVSLFIELKNEAMRERHWTELMKKTRQHVDISSHEFEEK